jgi:thiamine thiazole synthase
MGLDEITVSRAIITTQMKVLLSHMEMDVAVVGAGPAGLACAALVAEKGCKVGIIEKKLSIGGGMWGGGMMFPRIVVEEEARRLLDRFHVRYDTYEPGYYVAGSVEAVARLAAAACEAGAEFFNLVSVEDIMVKDDGRVSGLVINWTAVETGGLHVDPLTVACRYTVDATGHDAAVSRLVEKKRGKLKVKGEGFMWAERAEKNILRHTKEIYPGLIVAGMAANAVAGESRMGPVFGGMLLSGEKAAGIIIRKLKR